MAKLASNLRNRFLGSIDTKKIEVGTNVNRMNPLIASAIMIPILKYHKKKQFGKSNPYILKKHAKQTLIAFPWILPSPVSSSNAFANFYQRLVLDSDQPKLTIRMEWKDRQRYGMPPARGKESVAIKLDDVMSIVAIKYYEDKGFKIVPMMIAFSETEAQEKIEWAKKFWFFKDINIMKVFIIDYGIHAPYIDPRPYENWIFATIAGMYHAHVWLPISADEVTDYFPERSQRVMVEGQEWMAKIYQGASVIETPWPEKHTRTTIVKDMLDKGIITDENLILKSIRCRCGECLECLHNYVMLTNLDLDTNEIYPDGFTNDVLIKKYRELYERGKLNNSITTELKTILEV